MNDVKDKVKTGLKRDPLDKFYTNSDVAENCMKIFQSYVKVSDSSIIIEPSSGNGAFIPFIKKIAKNYEFYDIVPEHQDIKQQDYLTLDLNILKSKYDSIHIITNPPFGKQSSTAIKFIKKSCSVCDTLSFILPKSFKKESMRKKIPIHFHLIHESNLPKNSFHIINKDSIIEHDVPCIFQIWIKKEIPRQTESSVEPITYSFTKKDSNPDISIRRVGFYAGKINVEFSKDSVQSHYFIKFNNDKPLYENVENLKKISFLHDNTVGPKSISKQEIIKEFNKYIF